MPSFERSDATIEPSVMQRLTLDEKNRLAEVLDRYLSALENGVPPARDELLAAHADLAEPLRRYLDSLDDLHNIAIGFGSTTSYAASQSSLPNHDKRQLGDFRILREVGRGGMGIVYEAEQISLGRRVALKVLPFAAVLDARQIARFNHEAKAAAQLLHPNIASVFAVGVDRGVHYYAMQFIDGQPLDRAIVELRKSTTADSPVHRPASNDGPESQNTTAGLDTATSGSTIASNGTADLPCPSTCARFLTERSAQASEYFRTVMRLGIQAAGALHAAHEQGVVHRDIKPSNLMLDGDGKLWVTDFGLARCQTEAALTRTGDVIGTVRYMSPEQTRGESTLVDHRTDVYALGVTLYELLALQPAFSGTDGPALLHNIALQEPKPLRRLRPGIPADLETVVAKAMSKQREERYATAEAFADDLQRVLDGRPTLAKPPTIAERCTKWARRHKSVVAASAGVGLVALVGLAISTMLITREKIRAEQSYARAEAHFHDARNAVDRFGAQLAERLAGVPGAEGVRRELLQETLRYYRRYVETAKNDPTLREDLALTYSKIGMLAGDIGSTDEAIESQKLAVGLFQELVASAPQQTEYQRRLALCWNNLGLMFRRSGATDRARLAYREAIRLHKQLSEGSPHAPEHRSDLALSYSNLGLLQHELGLRQEAESSFSQAIHIEEQLLELSPNSPERLRSLAILLNNLSALDLEARPTKAVILYGKALAYQKKADELQPDQGKNRSDLALTYSNLGMAQFRTSQWNEAVESCQRAIEIQKELVRAAPVQRMYRRDLAVSYNNLGLIQSKLQRPSEAESSFRQGLLLQEALIRLNPKDVELQSSLGGIYNNLGMVLEDAVHYEEAAQAFEKAVEHQRIAHLGAPSVAVYRSFLSKHYFNLARVLRRLERGSQALKVVLARRELWPNDPKHLFAVAEELASITDVLKTPSADELSSQQCASLAIETLRHAVAAGWRPAPNQDWKASFAAIHNHPDFSTILSQ